MENGNYIHQNMGYNVLLEAKWLCTYLLLFGRNKGKRRNEVMLTIECSVDVQSVDLYLTVYR